MVNRPTECDIETLMSLHITPDLLLRAYRLGLFPMAESRNSPVLHWLDPQKRGILPLQGFHISRSLMKTLRSGRFTVTSDKAFSAVIAACAQARANRPETWINHEIERLFTELYQLGFAHSLETWENDELVGGLYGISLSGAFFGESMFSTATNASKVALAHLVARLRLGGYVVLDTQFITTHLASLGAIELPRDAYHALLAQAVETPAQFPVCPDPAVLMREFQIIQKEVL